MFSIKERMSCLDCINHGFVGHKGTENEEQESMENNEAKKTRQI